MPSPAQDSAFLQAGLRELEDYLLSKELYWQLSPPALGSDLPRLTIGGLLLASLRTRARAVTPAAQAEIDRLGQQMDDIRSRWRAAWESKVKREVHARIDLWRNFLMDYRQSPENYADAYPQEVHWRAMLHLLASELPDAPPDLGALPGLDQIVKACFQPDDFIWEADLQPGFPSQAYWFLYGRLKSK